MYIYRDRVNPMNIYTYSRTVTGCGTPQQTHEHGLPQFAKKQAHGAQVQLGQQSGTRQQFSDGTAVGTAATPGGKDVAHGTQHCKNRGVQGTESYFIGLTALESLLIREGG